MKSFNIFLLILGAVLCCCQKSSPLADTTTLTHEKCDIADDDLEDASLNLLQRSSSVKSVQQAKHMMSSVGFATTDNVGRKYDPENEVYNDVETEKPGADSSGGSSGSSSSPYSPGSSASSPSSPPPSPPPSPTPTVAPPSPTPTVAPPSPTPTVAPPSPTPTTAAPVSPTPAPTSAPTSAPATGTATATATATVTHTTTQTHAHTTITTTANSTNPNSAAAFPPSERSGYRTPGAIGGFWLGLILFIYSFVVNWKTEKAASQLDTLISRADSECKSVTKADPLNNNSLVIVSGPLETGSPVEDKRFNVQVKHHGIRSTVQVYAKEQEMVQDDGGKGKGKRHREETVFRWTAFPDTKPQGINISLGSETEYSNDSILGDGFLINLCDFNAGFDTTTEWSRASFGSEVKLRNPSGFSRKFTKGDDGKYYTGSKERPEVNDLMVEFHELQASKCTVMALQVESRNDQGKSSFLPYTLVPHECPCWSADSESEQDSLYKGGEAALQADKDISNEMNFWTCCTCAFCFGVMFRPEIFILDTTRSFTKNEIIKRMSDQEYTKKWVCRAVGYLMLFFGIAWMFMPISNLLSHIWIIGGILSDLVGFVIWVFALVTSIIIYMLLKIVAAVYFNPMWALIYSSILVVFIVAIWLLGSSSGGHHSLHKF